MMIEQSLFAASLSATEMDGEIIGLMKSILIILALIPALFAAAMILWLDIANHFGGNPTRKIRKPPDKMKAKSNRQNTLLQLLAIF